jgi:hypothetical protein
VHNPVLDGEFARRGHPLVPRAGAWPARGRGRPCHRCPRARGARPARPGARPRPSTRPVRDLRRKKLFLFGPERMALSIDRLRTTPERQPDCFQRYVLLTNYAWHVEEFRAALPDCTGPDSPGRQMPAWHYVLPDRAGVTMINIGVGPSNAKTITDHLAVLRPDLELMIGHCAGLRNHQEIGDLVLATAYLRDDRVLDDMLPLSVPVISNHTLNMLLLGELTARGLPSRMGIVFTTANRNWELQLSAVARTGCGSPARSRWTWNRRPSRRTASATGSRPPPCSPSATSRCTRAPSSARTRRPSTPPAAASTSTSPSPSRGGQAAVPRRPADRRPPLARRAAARPHRARPGPRYPRPATGPAASPAARPGCWVTETFPLCSNGPGMLPSRGAVQRSAARSASIQRPRRGSTATEPPEAVVSSPTASRGLWLVCRRHIDLLRVSSAICRASC